jgi:dephospho-CoA kinase
MSYCIGITGGIGAGKSLLAAALARRGVPVHDADAIGRLVVEANAGLRADLRATFGDGIFVQDELDRAALGRMVFADRERLARLDRLVLPYLLTDLRRRIAAMAAAPLQAIDAALLYEWGIEGEFDEVWVVVAPDGQRAARAAERLGLSLQEAWHRLESQLPQAEKAARADRVLVNDGPPEAVGAWLAGEWTRLLQAGHGPVREEDA